MITTETWKSWEGHAIEGRIALRQWLGGTQHSAVFLTDKPGQSGKKAVIKLIQSENLTLDGEVARLRAIAKLAHPHLIQIFDAGRCQIDGTTFVYVVMEHAEEDLSQILPQRPLSAGEVSELLPPVLDALSYLHSRGFVHGSIKPSNLLAVGDQLKLSADQVTRVGQANSARRRRDMYDAPETAAGIVSPAGDIWSVGVTLVAAITQNVNLAAEAAPGKSGLPENMPEPYRGIALECLQLDPKRRCSLSEIQARLQPPARSVPAPEPVPVIELKKHYRYSWRMLIPVAVLLAFVVSILLFHRNSAETASGADTSTSAAVSDAPVSVAAAPSKPDPTLSNKGQIKRQVMPEIPRSAQNTIRGTIKVIVRVDVNPAGKVSAAKLRMSGSSRYFANQALRAANNWEFSPPQVNGQPVASVWNLQFRFKRSSTQALPEQVSPKG